MKKGIHPEAFKSKVSCACGARFETISVEKEIRVEICSACHPFFTGEHRLVDSAGRVEKFKNRYKKRSKSN